MEGSLFPKMSAWAEQCFDIVMKYISNLPNIASKLLESRCPQAAPIIAAVQVDSPLILTYSFVIVFVHSLAILCGEEFNITFFSIWPFADFSFLSPLSYWRLFSHILGHGSWQHLQGNLVHLLLVGPSCEREYGAYPLLQIIVWTAIASGLAHMFIGGNGVQLGASGIVFMLILLNSLLKKKEGMYIPLTFILQVWIWVYKEVVAEFYAHDSISHVAHIAGAAVGTLAGYDLYGTKVHKRTDSIVVSWMRTKSKAKKI